MRDWFVGVLLAAAACLYLYKGFGDKENYLLNAAAVFAVGIAVNPSDWIPGWWFLPAKLSPHGICAMLFFFTIALACWWCQEDSLRLNLVPARDRKKYQWKYNLTGIFLLLLPALAVVVNVEILSLPFRSSVFWAEALAIGVFAFYWFTKSGELKQAMNTHGRNNAPAS